MSNTDTNTGGPAFPHAQWPRETGMTMRDYFIAHLPDEGPDGEDWGDWVKQEIVGRPRPDAGNGQWLSILEWEAEFSAKWRAIRADAMLKARAA